MFLYFLIIILIIIFLILGLNNKLEITYYRVDSKKIDNIRIILITDLHCSKYKNNQQELINKINEENPDLILYGGDMVDDKLPVTETEKLLKSLDSKYPSYYVLGNHEFLIEIDDTKELFDKYNVKILDGICNKIKIKNKIINICGLDDPDIGDEIFNKELENVGNSVLENNYNILLSHRPELINKYIKYDFDLILSGHAHGGQWRLPFLTNGLYSPHQGIFPKYSGGKYKVGNIDFIVSRGLARNNTFVPRFYNRPELVVIDINRC